MPLKRKIGSEEKTVADVLRWADGFLISAGVDESRLNAELLLAHAAGLPRTRLLLDRARKIRTDQLFTFQGYLERRAAREPLQYITGETEFMGLRFQVNRNVLVPRPETELLVECALEFLGTRGKDQCSVLDVGTGSGNIAIAIAKFMPWCSVTAIDASSEALRIARENKKRHGASNVRFIEADLNSDDWIGGTFDLITANLPYVAWNEYQALEPEVREYEPRFALTDGKDGLSGVRRLAGIAPTILVRGGAMLLEIAGSQKSAAMDIVTLAGFANAEVRSDLAGHPRVVCAHMQIHGDSV
jgi:release factor glutamine methyltransferase